MTTIVRYLCVTSCTASSVRLRPVEYNAIVEYVKTTRTRSQYTGYLNKNITMRCRLRQNATNVSEIYIGRPIYIYDVKYIYRTSDIPALALALALAEVGYCTSEVGYRYWTSNIYISDVGYRYPDVGYRYQDVGYRYPDVGYWYPDVGYRCPDVIGTRMSDIDIGRPTYILDVRYRFRKHWWHFVLNGTSYITGYVKQDVQDH